MLPGQDVITLSGKPETSRSPWMDAWRRLRRNRAALIGIVVIVLNILAALFAPMLTRHSYREQNMMSMNSAPQWVVDLFPKMKAEATPGGYVHVDEGFFFGTDALGRDLFARILYGARVSLAVAFVGPLFSLLDRGDGWHDRRLYGRSGG